MERRIISAIFPNKVGKVWAGDWYEKTYKRDIAEGAQGLVDKADEYNKEIRELEKMGVRISTKSELLNGEDRIKIQDKKKKEE